MSSTCYTHPRFISARYPPSRFRTKHTSASKIAPLMRKFLQGFICQIKHKEWKVFPLHVVEMYIANTFRVNPIINPCTRLDYKLFLLALHILYLKNVLNKWEIMWWVAATTSFIAIKYNTYKALIRKTYIVVWNSCVATRSQDHDNILKYHCQEFNIPFT